MDEDVSRRTSDGGPMHEFREEPDLRGIPQRYDSSICHGTQAKHTFSSTFRYIQFPVSVVTSLYLGTSSDKHT